LILATGVNFAVDVDLGLSPERSRGGPQPTEPNLNTFDIGKATRDSSKNRIAISIEQDLEHEEFECCVDPPLSAPVAAGILRSGPGGAESREGRHG
jgi:hypothetical protein